MVVNSATVEWDSGGQQANWDVVENWDTDALPTSSDTVALRNGDRVQYTASSGTTLISRLLLGDSATDNKGELKVSGGTLKTITSGNAVVSEIGRGQMGRLSLNGGSTTVNFGHRIRIGSGIDGFGRLSVSGDASLVVERAGNSSIDTNYGPVSIDLGDDDEGALGEIRIVGGSLTTRTGIVIGGNGIFRVRNSGPTEIGIGSHGTLDGFWLQKEGGILCVNIDDTATGITPIFIDEVDTSNGSAGDVVFADGALLYVDFKEASNLGTFTVMEWEGSVTDNGLAFHPDVNTDVWSFEIDTADKELRVTAATPTSLSSIIWRNTANNYLTATTGVKDNNFANKVNWGWDGDLTGAKAKIDFDGVNRAVLNSELTDNFAALEIGCNGGNGEFEQSGGSLRATANSAAVSSIGRNQTGTWIMSGGTAEINAIRIGLGDGAGNMIIEDGALTIKRAYGQNLDRYSLFVGSGGTANFEISGGSLTTRSGVKLSDKGTFSVRGSGATIGIGSEGTEDGRWVQESGGLLEVMIDDTDTGVTKIVVEETDGLSNESYNGDVTFEKDALLAPSFWGKAKTYDPDDPESSEGPYTYTIMEWDGTVTDNGLAFHEDVNEDVWSFNVDATNKRLTVTAQDTGSDYTAITVDSIEELRQYLDREYHDITMEPGTYELTGPTTRPAASDEGGRFLDFRGENSKYVFTDVHIKVDTQEIDGYGSVYGLYVIHVTGDNIEVDGLTLSMEKRTLKGKDKYGLDQEWYHKDECSLVRVIGSDTTIKNCDFTTGGSYPYGYSDAFGKGRRPVGENGEAIVPHITAQKMSGFLITEGASNVKVENVTLNMKSYGHGFYIQLGAKDIEYINCTILGDDMTNSDDIIAHPEYQKWGFATYKTPIPSDIRISKHEGGIRAYYNDDYQTNGYPERVKNVTIDNCRIERMRDATAFGDAAGYLRVSDTEVYECEMGFGTNGFGTENTFTNCKGDALNGPLIYFQRSVADNSTSMEIELTGDCPGKGIWPIALISGNDNEITLTSSAKPGVYSKGAYVNLSQKWREWRHPPDSDIDEEQSNHYAESSTGNTIRNRTDQILVFGENAEDNDEDCESWGPVIDKGSDNEYDGSDLVSGPIVVGDTWGSYTVYEGLEVYYSDNYPVYAWGVPITPNRPNWTTPGMPISYIISPDLPDDLDFDATTGVISGTPTELSDETTYLVKAYYTANIYATVDLRITVNDVVAILLEGTDESPDMRVTFNGSGSWVTAGSTVETFRIASDKVANSSHYSLGGTRKEGIRDVLITGGTGDTGDNPLKPALSGNFDRGQYVALNPAIQMTADVCKTPFNVIGLLFDDDEDEGAGKDDIVLVTDQPENTTTWPAGTKITYTVGATARFSLDSDIEAHFDDAFNKGTYTLDDGLVGSLEIDETVAPSNLNYDTNTVTYTLGEEITANEPSSNGSAVDSYSIDPALPEGLNFNTATGVISGTPSAPSGETTYTVTAENTAGWVTKTLTITVNDVVAILLEGIDYSRKMRVTFNGITGSWVTAAATASAFAYDDQDVANSDDESLKNDQEIGETKEGIRDVQITGGDPMNAALNGSNDAYPKGQYVALDTPITMEADQDPSEFNVIGLLFDDDSTDPTTNGDDIVLVTDQPDTTTWPAGTKITYTAGATATFSRDSSIGADFDDAFNIGVYTLNEGLVGSLQIDETVAPSELEYPTDDNDTLIFSLGVPVEYVPTSEGSAVDDYEISPVQLPAGLNFNTTTGVISGTPTELSAATDYTVTATNTAGSSTPVTLKIIVNDVVAILLEGTKDVYKMRVTFNGETGSWVTAADTEKAFTYDDDDVANSNDDSLGNLSREGFKVDRITGGNAMNAALNDTDFTGLPAYPEGQYVALATEIAMTATIPNADPSDFKVIGLLFNDDSTDPTPNGDDIVLVTDQPEDTTTWPAGTKITYTVGASTTFSLNSNLGADFDDAFNIDVYTLNEGLVGSLEIKETRAPTNLKYTQDNTLTFTLGVNTEYVPTSDGSAVDTYTITPALPDGLSLSASGVISGAPTGLDAATSYTVTATNTAPDSTTATLTITVNDVVVILLEGTTGVSQMRVTFKGETGSWVTAESTVAAFEYNNSNVLNSNDESLNNDQGTGETKEGIRDLKITGGNAINTELGGIYVMGQYVALDPSIAMEAETDGGSSEFKVIGLLFDDDGESIVNEDDITLVTDQPEDTTTWLAGTKITYTVGDTATFSLNIDPVQGIGADFDDAFNIGAYTLDEGLVGRLKIAYPVIPSELKYTTDDTLTFTLDEAAEFVPTSEGSAVDSYEIDPAKEQLPAGLDFDKDTGVISGTPTELSAATEYTVTAINTAGEDDVTLTITVNDRAPSALSYTNNSAVYTKGVTITDNSPSSSGGAVVSYSISPALPAELEFDQPTGEISGTPTELSSSVYYTVTATNTGGSATATLIITVNDEAPSNLRYTTNSATYYVGVVIITPNAPSSTGGAVVSYQISPSLPDGLEFDQVSGEISGTPTELSSETEYTVTAANTGGWVTAKLTITVRHEAPSNLRYTTNPAIYTKDVEIADNVPSSTGGAVGSYQISPSLPDGLNFDPATGVISGTPNELSAETDYTVTAINTGGSDTVKLTITVNHEAPSNLSYTTNPAIYTKDVEIADNVPTSTGGAVGNYSISPALPAGLSLSTSSGVISGTPNAVSPATDYTVTATNTAGSATVTLRITVNDQKHLVLLLKGTSGSRDMRVTFNGTGSWVTAAETANAFTYGDPQVANSSDSSLTNAESKEGFQDLLITGGDPMKAALSDSSENGQYVALATPIAMTSDDGAGPFSFNVIGLLFDDDSTDSTPNGDDIVLVTDQPDTTTWPAGTEISYTVGASATFSLDSTIGADFDEAFNQDIYDLDEGLVGSLKLVEIVALTNLKYTTDDTLTFTRSVYAEYVPTSDGSAVDFYEIDPPAEQLPAGLNFSTTTGVIWGTPSELSAATDYTVTAYISDGSTSVSLTITVNDVAPSGLSYTTNPAIYTVGTAITDNAPSSTGGEVVSYSIVPEQLPDGLSLSASGVISGTPAEPSVGTTYTVTATNTGGSATVNLTITVNDVAPSGLSYATNPAIYTKDVTITDNSPSSTGGNVVSYLISPALPAGLSLDTATGVISGTPSELSAATEYTVTAYNSDGSTSVSLTITVNDVAPSALSYATNPAIYTKDVPITANEPTSTGGAVVSYSISPSLPAGLSLSASGVISGTPTAVSPATTYTVTATNSVGSVTATLRIAVNDPKHLVLLLKGTSGSRDMTVTFNGTGSWVAKGPTASAFTHDDDDVANSDDASLNNDQGNGETKEGFRDVQITGGDPMNAALSVGFTDGQYVALDTSITMIPDGDQTSSFEVIGLLFNDDTESGEDQIVLVTDEPDTTTWSVGTEISYAVGASTTFSLDSSIEAHFDEAFNQDIYDLDEGLVGSLKLGEIVPDEAPSGLTYGDNNTLTFTLGEEITSIEPTTSGGSAVGSYSIAPDLPAGLSLDTATGEISGTPSELSAATSYTVTANNSGGSATATLNIAVNDVAPSNLSYTTHSAVYTKGVEIANNSPSSSGGAVVSYSITPALPAGLSLSTSSGVISGTPSAVSAATDYTVKAINTGGRARVNLRITVNDVAPSDLSYTTHSAVYTKGVAITNNGPSSAGGAVVSYSISPALPAGLSFDTATGVISGKPTAVSPAASYTVTATNSGGSARVNLRITVNDVAPSDLSYTTHSAVYTKGVAITNNGPSSAGGAVVSYSISPALPAGLSFDTATGVISGKPTAVSPAASYTVTATNSGGSARVNLRITVNDMAPSALSYTNNPAIYTKGEAITDNSPSSAGGAVVSYSISPALPAGLSLDTATGVISGAPTAVSPAAHYTVRATNTGGRARVTLRITVNDMAPSALSYALNPAIYTKDVGITDNTPSSAGGAVVSYSISPALPARLSLDTATGVISGTPTVLSAANDYTVTATNSGGSARVNLRITVNDEAPSNLKYALNPAIYTKDVGITDNTPSSAGGAVVSYSISPALPARLSLDTATGVISGTPTVLSAANDYTVTATNSGGSATVTLRITVNDVTPSNLSYTPNPAIYTKGVTITDNSPSSAGGAVVSYSISPALPAGLSLDTATGVISGTPNAVSAATDYTVKAINTGGRARVTLRITVNDVAPSNLSYTPNPAVYTKGVAITNNGPSSAGGAVVSYSISPALPAGLSLDTATGVISGTPNAVSAATDYTVKAINTGGRARVTLRITVNDVAPSNLSYTPNPAVYTKGVAITNNGPSSAGGAVVSYSISPALPAGLSFDTATGVISGKPNAVSAAAHYTVKAINTGGRARVTLRITVNDVAPSNLSYTPNPAIYTKGVTITDNSPSSAGGAVVSYSISPALPAGLSFDTATGVISGKPTAVSAAAHYTVKATNTGGRARVTLRITVNDVAPSNLSYTPNPAIYTKGVTITDNSPSSAGGAVVSYSISPALPAGLSLDTATGVISGTPTAVSAATSYTVRATNSGGWVTATLRIAVNDEKHLVLLLEGTSGSRDMRVTFNGTGSWVAKGPTASAFTHGDDNVANSSDSSLGNAESKEGFQDVQITGGDPMKAALNGRFTDGQYVAFANPIAMTANAEPTSFNVIGLLFNDDNDTDTGQDEIVLVTDEPDTTTWSVGTEISYAVGASTTFSLDSGIGATFDDAFNQDIYDLDEGLVGSLKLGEIVPDVAPSGLSYANNPAIYTKGVEITNNSPSSSGGAVVSYSIAPSLPAGLSFDTATGVISGKPRELSEETEYTVTATNTRGSATVSLTITVNDVAPSNLKYALNPAIYTKGEAITDNSPSSAGGAVVSYSISPALPAGLSLDTATGVISGKPTELSAAAHYTVRATNTGGRARVTLRITVNDMAPSNLSYTTNPAIYTKGVTITNNSPSSAGGAVVSYSITPSLPAGLSLDTATGVISGKPTELSAAAHYTVRATNTGGRARVTLRITVNDMAPSNLKYALNPAIYTKDVAITDNSPSSTGGNVVSYSISPALPARLSLDTATGVISGTPNAVSAAANYTVTATNTGGSATVTLRITVNDVTPSNLSYTPNPAIYTKGVTITDNSPSSSGGAVVSYSISPALPAGLSLDTATGVISGTPTALSAETDYTVTATNSGGSATVSLTITVNDVAPSNLSYTPNPAIYTKGEAITDNSPSSAGGAVVSYSISPALPAGLSLDTATGVISGKPSELSAAAHYTVRAINTGGRARVTLRITVNDMAPSNLSYTTNPAIYTKGEAITDNSPSSAGGAVVSYSISPALPAGLSFDTATGVISGKPTELSAAAHYTVRATNTGGRARVTLRITVNDMAPSALSYANNPAIYTKGVAITDNSPSSTGGNVVSYSISPALPARLSLDTATGVISGKPNAVSAAANYTVTATNTGGSATVTLRITVNDVTPSNLSYTPNPAIYTKGVTITDNSPSSTGGAVVSYSITPSLPAGLSLDTATGVISGTPTAVSAATSYTVRATNTGGRVEVTLTITVNDVAPSALSYATNPAIYTKDVTITDNSPSSTGGAVVSYSITPSLPARLNFDPATGVISGTPTALSAATTYTVTATNTGGSDTVSLTITVNNGAPSGLSYTNNPAIYTKGVTITNNSPSSTGGAVVSYSITPSLPAGLSLDTASGVISGTPTALSAATDYTVTATNSGGSDTATLNIAVNDVMPSALSYATNPAIYTKDVTITDNSPSSTGGAVVSYSITPSLPAGLNFNPATGVISGTPSELSPATTYTVRATNSGGSVTATLRIAVNDQKHLVLLLEGTTGVSQMRVTFNGTGSWVMKSDSDTSFSFGSSQVANSSNASLGGSSKEALQNVQISGGNPMNVALSGSFENGQYVGLATPIAMTGDDGAGRFSFNVIGLLFDDDSTDSTPNGDDIVLVTDQPDTSSWTSYFTEIFYTVGASTTFSLDSGIGATFDEAFNKGSYTLDEGLVGSLKIANPVIPSNLQYTKSGEETPTLTLTFTRGVFAEYLPSSGGSAVDSYEIDTALPDGLRLQETGVISGTPTVWSPATTYTVTAENTTGEDDVTLTITVKLPLITVNDGAPSALSYTTNPATYTKDVEIADNEPSSSGGAVVSYTISPALPAGLEFDQATGEISGTPTELSAATSYTVRATNTAGWVEVTLTITVNDGAPSALSYTTNPAIYTKDLAIADNSPSSRGGNVAYYWITPALPSGLSFDRYTGVISGTPTELSAATYYKVRATNTSSGWVEVTLMITIVSKELQEWRQAHFSAEDLENPAMQATVWGNMANPDGDRWMNSFEFFFGTDPNSFDMHSPMRYEFVEEEVDCIAVLEFERSKAAPAGAGVVQYASDLSQWQTVSAPAEVVEDLGDRELVRVSIRLEQQATRHFMRLALDLEMF